MLSFENCSSIFLEFLSELKTKKISENLQQSPGIEQFLALPPSELECEEHLKLGPHLVQRGHMRSQAAL